MALSGSEVKAVAGAVCIKVISGGGGGGTSGSPAESFWRHLGHMADDAKITVPSTKTEIYAQPSLGKIKSETIEDSYDFTAKLLEGSYANPSFLALALGRNPVTYNIASGLPITPGEGNLIVEVKVAMYYEKFTNIRAVTNCLVHHIKRAAVITENFELVMSAIKSKKWSEIPIKFEAIADPIANGKLAVLKMPQTCNLDVNADNVKTYDASNGFFADLAF